MADIQNTQAVYANAAHANNNTNIDSTAQLTNQLSQLSFVPKTNVNDLKFEYGMFDTNLFIVKPPNRRDNLQKKLTWFELPFAYNYGSVDAPREGRFQFIGPEFTFTRGIVPQMNKEGTKIEYYKLNIPLKIGDSEHEKIIAMGDWLHQAGLLLIQQYNKEVGRPTFDATNPMAIPLLQKPVFNPDDLPMDQRQPGQGPTVAKYMRCKVLDKYDEKTIVRDPDGNTYDWRTLLNRPFVGVPIINVSHIYIPRDALMTFQIKLTALIITKPGVSKISPDFGLQDAAKFKQTDPEAGRKIKEELSKPYEAPSNAVTVPMGKMPGVAPGMTGIGGMPNMGAMHNIESALTKAAPQLSNMKFPTPAPAPKQQMPVFPAALGKGILPPNGAPDH